MLILERRQDETIVIDTSDGQIVIGPVRIERGKVRLGISAPEDIRVHRSEVYAQIHGGEVPTLARAG